MPASTDVFSARILIVDDQDCNVRLLEHALRRGGHSAISSTTNPVAVDALQRQNRYDLIILDLQMPGMNGFEVLKGLLPAAEDEQGTAAAVLILSADPSQEARALAAGASGFLSKPFLLTNVLDRARLLLESRAVPRTVIVPAA